MGAEPELKIAERKITYKMFYILLFFFFLVLEPVGVCLGVLCVCLFIFVNLTQARIFWEEEPHLRNDSIKFPKGNPAFIC